MIGIPEGEVIVFDCRCGGSHAYRRIGSRARIQVPKELSDAILYHLPPGLKADDRPCRRWQGGVEVPIKGWVGTIETGSGDK